ncbi:MAG: ABC transporter substrate-binding protein [Desulfamplus sp.]|nr:ABC transporter substrate-binding protein [Desulfamplus sp.]
MKKSTIIFTLLFFTLFIGVSNLYAQDGGEKYKIAAIQHQDMILFSDAFDGFKKGLNDLGYTDKVEIEHFNAKKDIPKLDETIEQYSTRDDLDLIFAIGTRSAVGAVKKIKTIPILYTGVTDPENSGLVTDWKTSGRNYTGIATPDYLTMGIKLLFENLEDTSSLGMIYLTGDPSHVGGVRGVEKFSQEAGFKFVYKGFDMRDKDGNLYPKEVLREYIREALEYVLPQVKLFFVQPSQSFYEHFDIFHEAFVKYGIFSAGDPMYIKNGIIMGIGRDIKEFGKQAAEYAVKILNGESPANLPMDTGEKFLIEFNLQAAELVDFAPPIMLLSATDIIHKELETKEIKQ